DLLPGCRAAGPLFSSALPADAELVAGARRPVAGEVDLQQFFALHRSPLLIRERGNDPPAACFHDLAGGWVGIPPVQAERHPAGLVAQRDAGALLRRHGRGVEDVEAAVVRVAEPELALVGRQSDAVARAAVTLRRPLLYAGDLHPPPLPAARQVADLESKQVIDVDEAERLAAIHGEGANHATERPDRAGDRVSGHVGDGEFGRAEPGAVRAPALS